MLSLNSLFNFTEMQFDTNTARNAGKKSKKGPAKKKESSISKKMELLYEEIL